MEDSLFLLLLVCVQDTQWPNSSRMTPFVNTSEGAEVEQSRITVKNKKSTNEQGGREQQK